MTDSPNLLSDDKLRELFAWYSNDMVCLSRRVRGDALNLIAHATSANGRIAELESRLSDALIALHERSAGSERPVNTPRALRDTAAMTAPNDEPKLSPAETKPLWRVGTKLGRTLYRDEVCVGMVDTPEIAAEIVDVLNRAAVAVTDAETERHIKALHSHGVGACCAATDAAVDYLRALQQRVTELEAELSETQADLRSVERSHDSACQLRDEARSERDAAKRKLALRLDGHRELRALYASFWPRQVGNPDEAAQYVSKLRAERDTAERELAALQAALHTRNK